MPWKQVKESVFRSPTRQDVLVIAVSLILGLLAIAFFALRP